MENVEKLLYTRKEAAFALAFSLRRIEYMISQGLIKTKKYGARSIRIHKSEVQRIARTDMPLVLESGKLDN